MRAISIRQPWVELIFGGEKQAEYRSRPTHIRGRVYLYASLTVDTQGCWNSEYVWYTSQKKHWVGWLSG